jgi:hypothetical protein
MNDEVRALEQAHQKDPPTTQITDSTQSLQTCLLFHKDYSKNSYIKSLVLKIQLSLANIP